MQKGALPGSTGPGKGSGTAAAAASQQAAALQSSKVDSTLVTLRMRALDVHARLAELGDGVAQLRDGLGPGRNLTWNEFLNKFHALSQLYVQLTTELERAVTDMGLENYILQPRGVAEDPGIVPDLLRTKQEPEVERDRDALASEFRTEVGESGMTDEAISRRIHAFNALVDSTIDQFKDLREDMALPKLAEPQPKRPPPAADAILAALTSGAGLR